MSLARYLASRWATLLLVGAALVLVGVVLYELRIPAAVVVVLLSSVWLCLVVALGSEWALRRRYLQELHTASNTLDKPTLAAELVARPLFPEDAITYDAMKRALKGMNDELADARRQRDDYRHYIETWIHEVKTPIAAAHLLAQNRPTPEATAMAREVARIERYVEQALYYARSTAVEQDYVIAPVNLGEVVRAALRRHKYLLMEARVLPQIDASLDRTVLTDAKWMEFILGQIVVNSAAYAAPDGPRWVRFFTDEQGLHIQDNGRGIPATDLPRVFEKGFTGTNGRTPTGQASTGMGLYVVRRLLQAMDAQVSVTSHVGQGTTVTLSLTYPSAPETDVQTEPSTSGISRGTIPPTES